MFTGLIEAVGQVAAVGRTETGLRIRVRSRFASELSDGESVAVSGVCLTATDIRAGEFHADIGPETARVTTLGGVREGEAVNLERAMRADARFGGHFVQGHVDAVASVRDVRADGEAHWLKVAFPAALAPFFIHRGSVAVDGVSLTVAALAPDHFDVMIIPFTWTHTTLASLQVGSAVNLECDVVGKYVARAVQVFGSG